MLVWVKVTSAEASSLYRNPVFTGKMTTWTNTVVLKTVRIVMLRFFPNVVAVAV